MVAVAASPNTEPLRGVAAWLAEAHDVAWGCASDGEILEALEAMPLIRNQIDALAARAANAAERSGAVQRDGSRNAAIWTGANTPQNHPPVASGREPRVGVTGRTAQRRHHDLTVDQPRPRPETG